ncbi:ribosome small subunit-dependent GTPase A [Bauldia sp.]|uniref:ribosome small subunit-dependent GTPase A n=1 Tax=Bauldia sp. TaxID=2575872 RepID=UPI003BAB2DCC
MTSPQDLTGFGWSNAFQSQLSLEDMEASEPARVVAVHRNGLDVSGPGFSERVGFPPTDAQDEESWPTVGDWLLVAKADHRPLRLLERKTLFKRRAAGTGRRIQLIAANVDTLLIVSSCNQDFNPRRLERYLILARDAGVMPVIVLTKVDLVDDPTPYRVAAERLMSGLLVECVDARSDAGVAPLQSWCGPGQTVALVGSSGVGKSTLVNTLAGNTEQATQPVRADDDHGRHTTTGRSLHRLADGGWLIDTPGMRELQLVDSEAGVEALFDDIVALAAQCRFGDCAHDTEPGCAVQAALADGTLAPERFRRYRKLQAEEAHNSASIAERRAREKGFGRMVKAIMRDSRKR